MFAIITYNMLIAKVIIKSIICELLDNIPYIYQNSHFFLSSLQALHNVSYNFLTIIKRDLAEIQSNLFSVLFFLMDIFGCLSIRP